jgi:osmotically inducible lipoprotein OsmB
MEKSHSAAARQPSPPRDKNIIKNQKLTPIGQVDVAGWRQPGRRTTHISNCFYLFLRAGTKPAFTGPTRQQHEDMDMDKRLIAAVMATGTLALGACSGTPTHAQVGATTGAVIGGVVGSALTGSTAGTVIGAGAGAAAGHEIGKRVK